MAKENALKNDGSAWCWGTNQDFIEEPVKVLDDVKMVWMDEVRFDMKGIVSI